MFINATLYNMQVLFGIIMFLIALKIAPKTLKVEIDQVLRFAIACILIFSVQACVYASQEGVNYIDMNYLEGINSLAAVWWEDACFVLPYILLYHFLGKKSYFFFPVFIATSYLFMLGHAYQGPTGQITFLFPFISFYYARKYGSGTMMLCHIIYDTTIVLCFGGLRHVIAGDF